MFICYLYWKGKVQFTPSFNFSPLRKGKNFNTHLILFSFNSHTHASGIKSETFHIREFLNMGIYRWDVSRGINTHLILVIFG